MLTAAQFRYGFGNTISEEESKTLYDADAIPSPGRPLFEAAFAGFIRNSPAAVDTGNSEPGPLLIISGGADHPVPDMVSRSALKPGTTSPRPAERHAVAERNPMTEGNPRCAWALGSELMTAYHDTEWGRPSRDDAYLFELLLLEGAQAGLSWSTVLTKRENYRAALDGFDVHAIAGYGQPKLDELMADAGIVRNRLKVRSTVRNAKAFLAVQAEYGSFAEYLWQWVDHEPVVNNPRTGEGVPASTPLSDKISKDLKRRGFTFVGTTIVYSYLQAVGVVDDHVTSCPAKPVSRPAGARAAGRAASRPSR